MWALLPVRLAVYFVVGGALIATVVYFSSQGRGLVAAFIAMVPSTTLLTFIFAHLEGGTGSVQSYARGLLFLSPAWLAYIAVIVLSVEKWGLGRALLLGVAAFLVLSLLIHLTVRNWTG